MYKCELLDFDHFTILMQDVNIRENNRAEGLYAHFYFYVVYNYCNSVLKDIRKTSESKANPSSKIER